MKAYACGDRAALRAPIGVGPPSVRLLLKVVPKVPQIPDLRTQKTLWSLCNNHIEWCKISCLRVLGAATPWKTVVLCLSGPAYDAGIQ